MGTFTFKATVTQIFTASKDESVTVEAENLEKAREEAREILESVRISTYDAERDGCPEINSLKLINHIPAEGEALIPVRCPDTVDMFSKQKG